jgi:large subunit ribosomal protein L32
LSSKQDCGLQDEPEYSKIRGMPNEPKKRHSRARQGKRRAAINFSAQKSVVCENCGSRRLSHTVCAQCGFYKKQQVLAKDKQQAA